MGASGTGKVMIKAGDSTVVDRERVLFAKVTSDENGKYKCRIILKDVFDDSLVIYGSKEELYAFLDKLEGV